MTAAWTLLDEGNLLIGDDDGDIIEAQHILFAGIAGGSAFITLIAAATRVLPRPSRTASNRCHIRGAGRRRQGSASPARSSYPIR